jgi:hypothetical protein
LPIYTAARDVLVLVETCFSVRPREFCQVISSWPNSFFNRSISN